MHSIKIKSLEIHFSPADKQDMLVATVEVFRDDKELFERKFMYLPETSESAIVGELEKMKLTLDSDYQTELSSKKAEDDNKNLKDLKKSLTGKII